MIQDRAHRRFIKRERAQARGYSQAIITHGGGIVWMAGQTAAEDEDGRSLAGDIAGQTRECFRRIEQTLQEAGGSLKDLVKLTIYLTDGKYADEHHRERIAFMKERFGDDFPCATSLHIVGLTRTETLVEIEGIAVVG